MPRVARRLVPGVCYHVLNRGNDRRPLFRKPQDFAAFVAILAEALARFDVELLCWCLMPNHWHLVLRPRTARGMVDFMRWVTITHVRRHHGHYPSRTGHLYQGRYKSFPVEADAYFLTLCRYVEANALRAGIVSRAERWEWSSLWQREHSGSGGGDGGGDGPVLSEWPVERPEDWIALVNAPLPRAQAEAIRTSVRRDRPLGSERWVKRMAQKLGLQQTLRPRGRPRKRADHLSQRQRYRRKK
jgi:putative transposase